MTSHWTKAEVEIMINNYEKTTYQEISEMLPKKTRQQILNRAKKLGLKRDESLLPEKIYYDNEEKAWVRETETETAKVRAIHPAPEGQSYEETISKFTNKVAKTIYDLSKKLYPDFLVENDLYDHPKLFDLYSKVVFYEFLGEKPPNLEKEINEVIDTINPEVNEKRNQKDE
ncbi:hypothetical protein AB1K32_07510 [Metabacillus dongyingensis]|uniref:hypothetical protein n=1 Tax=Metabacillus dongyingensis TaxID=2874282 RepID=UPI003B8C6B9E